MASDFRTTGEAARDAVHGALALFRGHRPIHCADCGALMRRGDPTGLPRMDGRVIDRCAFDCPEWTASRARRGTKVLS